MAATILVKDFFRGVSVTLQDNPQFSRWPETDMVRAANYGLMALAKILPQVGSRVDAIKLAAGTRQDITKILAANIKPGDGSTAADAHGIALLKPVRNMGTDGLTPGRVIRVVDGYTVDSNDPDWHTRVASSADIAAGRAVRELVYDREEPRVFWTVPGIPAGQAVWIDVAWLVQPAPIPAAGAPGSEHYAYDGASTVVLGINDQFVEDLHNYCVAMLLMKGSKNTINLPKAQAHAQLFLASVNAMVSTLTGTSPNLKMLPFVDSVPTAA